MRRLLAFVFLLAFLGAGILGFLASFGHFGEIEREFSGRCETVRGLPGPEDVAVDYGSQMLFVSSLDRRNKSSRGGVFLVDPVDPLNDRGWRDATGGMPTDFRPAGIDFFSDAEDRRLFVVNEAAPGISMYAVGEDDRLVFLETLSERRLTAPNSIVATGPSSFYVTNDATAPRHTLMGVFQFLTRSQKGQILYYNNGVWSVVASGLRFANGIALSADGATLYVSESAGKLVQVFGRDKKTGSLTPRQAIELQMAPDNLTIDPEGALWIAGMPKPLALPAHRRNADYLAPSEIIRVDLNGQIEKVYLDNGGELSASSVAAHVGGKLMIGAIYDDKFLLCDLPKNSG